MKGADTMEKKKAEQETLAERLRRMAQTDIRAVDRDTLVERSTVKLDPGLSREERILSFIEQIKNPYCYLDDGVVVKISFMDTDVTLEERLEEEYTADSLMQYISMVFQNVYLFNDTIENNIRFGNPDATHEQIVEAAKRAQCHDFISALPKGYDTTVGEGGSSLSGGEKQRISIARAILKDAPIVILDEATSSVDPENEPRTAFGNTGVNARENIDLYCTPFDHGSKCRPDFSN